MAKKRSPLSNGIAMGSGFLIGYFLTKYFIFTVVFIAAIWGTCNLITRKDSNGNSIASELNKLEKSIIPEVYFDRVCPILAAPRTSAKQVSSTIPGEKYRLLRQRGNWKKIVISGFEDGWVNCNNPVQNKSVSRSKTKINHLRLIKTKSECYVTTDGVKCHPVKTVNI